MDEATLKRATEPFFTTKGAGRGTGLGLSMVDGLVAQSGGAMRITSQPGIGTTVELWLPVVRRSPAERDAAGGRSPGHRRAAACRVLVVDDDPIVAAGTAAMLEDLGHVATEVDSGGRRRCRCCARKPAIDLVITDHAMPGMTGTELATRIRRRLAGAADRDRHRLCGTARRARSRRAAPVEAIPPAGSGRTAWRGWSASSRPPNPPR